MLLPKIVSVSEFDCVTGWTRLDSSWEGVQFAEIARQARPTAKAKYATIECYGTPFYTTSLPLDYLMHDDVLFAYNLDGKPLAPKYGAPQACGSGKVRVQKCEVGYTSPIHRDTGARLLGEQGIQQHRGPMDKR